MRYGRVEMLSYSLLLLFDLESLYFANVKITQIKTSRILIHTYCTRNKYGDLFFYFRILKSRKRKSMETAVKKYMKVMHRLKLNLEKKKKKKSPTKNRLVYSD